MKVIATKKGFYDKIRIKGDEFNLVPRNDAFIIKHREEKTDKKVTDAERNADVKRQLSSEWMKEVKAKAKAKEE